MSFLHLRSLPLIKHRTLPGHPERPRIQEAIPARFQKIVSVYLLLVCRSLLQYSGEQTVRPKVVDLLLFDVLSIAHL
jgi:hypothetical protein